MPHRTVAIIGALAVALASHGRVRASADRTLVAHDFSMSAQGWLVAGDTGVVAPTHQPRGGNPGGYISSDDEPVGETWYFRAPDVVLKQLPAAEHGLLKYSLKQSDIDAGFPDDDVVITGRAGRLSYRFPHSPGTDWTDFSIPLSAAAGWRWNWNQPATQEQMRSVLTQPVRFEIRGEYRTGPDVGGLDNVSVIGRD